MSGIVLASGSSTRLEILKTLGYPIKTVAPQDVDETVLKGEKPRTYVRRVTEAKLQSALKAYPNEVILSADTTISVGRCILQKAQDAEEQKAFMRLFSGRRHKVLTCVMLYDPQKAQNPISQRLVETIVQLKRLTEYEIDTYVASNVWKGCAGYRFDYLFQSFTMRMSGSLTAIEGLPVYEAKNLLESAGFLPNPH